MKKNIAENSDSIVGHQEVGSGAEAMMQVQQVSLTSQLLMTLWGGLPSLPSLPQKQSGPT